MEELYDLFNELSDKQRKLVIETPTLLNAFCAEASEKIGVDIEVLKTHLLKLDAYAKGEADRVVRLTKSIDAVKDKSLRLIERQSGREFWYQELIATPLALALAVREQMDDGVDYDSALERAQSEEYAGELEKAEIRLGRISDLTSLIQKPQLIRWDDGSTRAQREKKATMYHDILNHIKKQDAGMTKTELLRSVGKDNSSWRSVCGEVLDYMVSREIIINQGRKYHHASTFHSREHGYHRTIYELIVKSPQTKTSILKNMGYNNAKGRTKLSKALDLMMVEGLLTTDGTKWSVI